MEEKTLTLLSADQTTNTPGSDGATVQSFGEKRRLPQFLYIATLVLSGLFSECVLFCASPTWAAPIHYPDTVMHPHIPSWEDGDGHHQHRSNHQVMDWGNGAGKYDANKVWTNENLNFVGDTSHGSHGFIEEDLVPAPDFFFTGMGWNAGEGALAMPLVAQAFADWSAITSDRPTLITGILFSPTSIESVAEILVHWATPAEFGDLAGGTAAFFDPNPHGTGTDITYDLVFDSTESWYFGGDEAGFLASIKEWDFFTVALHEVGHVVGLQHQTDITDIMFTGVYNAAGDSAASGFKEVVDAGGIFRMIGADGTDGARDLYSVPIPEPSTLILFGSVLAGLAPMASKRQRRA